MPGPVRKSPTNKPSAKDVAAKGPTNKELAELRESLAVVNRGSLYESIEGTEIEDALSDYKEGQTIKPETLFALAKQLIAVKNFGSEAAQKRLNADLKHYIDNASGNLSKDDRRVQKTARFLETLFIELHQQQEGLDEVVNETSAGLGSFFEGTWDSAMEGIRTAFSGFQKLEKGEQFLVGGGISLAVLGMIFFKNPLAKLIKKTLLGGVVLGGSAAALNAIVGWGTGESLVERGDKLLARIDGEKLGEFLNTDEDSAQIAYRSTLFEKEVSRMDYKALEKYTEAKSSSDNTDRLVKNADYTVSEEHAALSKFTDKVDEFVKQGKNPKNVGRDKLTVENVIGYRLKVMLETKDPAPTVADVAMVLFSDPSLSRFSKSHNVLEYLYDDFVPEVYQKNAEIARHFHDAYKETITRDGKEVKGAFVNWWKDQTAFTGETPKDYGDSQLRRMFASSAANKSEFAELLKDNSTMTNYSKVFINALNSKNGIKAAGGETFLAVQVKIDRQDDNMTEPWKDAYAKLEETYPNIMPNSRSGNSTLEPVAGGRLTDNDMYVLMVKVSPRRANS